MCRRFQGAQMILDLKPGRTYIFSKFKIGLASHPDPTGMTSTWNKNREINKYQKSKKLNTKIVQFHTII